MANDLNAKTARTTTRRLGLGSVHVRRGESVSDAVDRAIGRALSGGLSLKQVVKLERAVRKLALDQRDRWLAKLPNEERHAEVMAELIADEVL